jgi:two-component system chemotaxis response regulator CheY
MALNILVVDDSSVMRDIIKKTMRMTDLPVGNIHEAANGQEGMDILDNQWIDLALVDIHMPVMNGEEMIEKIRSNPDMEDLAVIVVSSESCEERIEMLLEKGTKFIHKPFTPESLSETVTDMLGEFHDEK